MEDRPRGTPLARGQDVHAVRDRNLRSRSRSGVRRPALPDLAAGSPWPDGHRRSSPGIQEDKNMRHLRILVGVSALALVLSSCGQKTETATSQSASDSLL